MTLNSRQRTFKNSFQTFKGLIQERSGLPFPDDPHDQLWGAVGAVFSSWNNNRAVTYRRLEKHSGRMGHCGHGSGYGVWESGRELRYRCRLYPRPLHWRKRTERRFSHQRPGGRCGGRYPHAATDYPLSLTPARPTRRVFGRRTERTLPGPGRADAGLL